MAHTARVEAFRSRHAKVCGRRFDTGLNDPCTGTTGSGTISEFRAQLHAAHKAAKPFLKENAAREAYWCQVWERVATNAAVRVETNRKLFYKFRLVATISSIIVPSLVGLNLSGTGGTAIRWLTFTFSLVAAISTAVLTLFRFGDRWLINRKLADDLTNAAWTFLNNPGTSPARTLPTPGRPSRKLRIRQFLATTLSTWSTLVPSPSRRLRTKRLVKGTKLMRNEKHHGRPAVRG